MHGENNFSIASCKNGCCSRATRRHVHSRYIEIQFVETKLNVHRKWRFHMVNTRLFSWFPIPTDILLRSHRRMNLLSSSWIKIKMFSIAPNGIDSFLFHRPYLIDGWMWIRKRIRHFRTNFIPSSSLSISIYLQLTASFMCLLYVQSIRKVRDKITDLRNSIAKSSDCLKSGIIGRRNICSNHRLACKGNRNQPSFFGLLTK